MSSEYATLHLLPVDHRLRNTPLDLIAAQCRNNETKAWRDVEKWKIGGVTFNELSECWHECCQFRVPLDRNSKTEVD